MIQRTQPSIMLPHTEIEDEKTKKIFEEYNKIFSELATNIYSDIKSIMARLDTLEGE